MRSWVAYKGPPYSTGLCSASDRKRVCPFSLLDIYYLAFPKDPFHIKSLVALVYVLDIVQAGLFTSDAFLRFATEWGDLTHLDDLKLLWLSTPIFAGLGASLAKYQFLWCLC